MVDFIKSIGEVQVYYIHSFAIFKLWGDSIKMTEELTESWPSSSEAMLRVVEEVICLH